MSGNAISFLKVEADWGRNRLFSDLDADITAYVVGLRWRYGFTEPGQLVAPPSSAEITLLNASGDWNVGQPGSKFADKLRPGTMIRIVHDNVVRRQMYIGKIVSIRFLGSEYSDPICQIQLSDWMTDLQEASFEPFLQADVTTGVAIAQQVFESGLLFAPYADAFWIIDGSQLGVNTRVYENVTLTSVSVGQTALAFVGDNLDRGGGVNARSFIEEMCAAELTGRFWYDAKSGGFAYRGRHEWYNQRRIAGVNLNEWGEMADYTYGDLLVNDVTITVMPRSVGAPGTTLYRSTAPISMPPNTTNSVIARYRDPQNPQASCGAQTVVPLVPGVDYTVNASRDGLGADLTTTVTVTMNAGRASSQIIFNNPTTSAAWLTLLQVRGTPITAHDQVDIRANQPDSITTHGLRKQVLTVGSIGDTALVQEFASLHLRRCAKLRPEWRKWTSQIYGDGSTFEGVLFFSSSSSVGRVFRAENNWSGVSSDVVVLAEEHDINIAQNLWRVSLMLEPADLDSAWMLDFSALDINTIVAF